MKTLQKIVLILYVTLWITPSFAQSAKYNRIEYSENNIKYYGCVPMDENGLLLKTYISEKQTSRKNNTFTYVKLDTSFTQQATADVSIPARKADYIDFTNKNYHYNFAHQLSGNYSVSIVSIKDMATKTIQGKFPKNTIINTLRAVGDNVYFLGYTKDLPILICQNIKTNEITFCKIIPLNKRHFSIISFEVNEETNEAYLFTKDFLKDEHIVKFHVFKDGTKVSETKLESPDHDKIISSAFASRLQDGSYIFSGTYNNSKRNPEASVGIFIMKKIFNEKTNVVEFIKYINYLDINNFTSYLSSKKQERIEKKQERLNSQNKELEFNYLMAPHKIIEKDGSYVLVGEAYSPTYRQECQYINTGMGQTMHCYPVFDGYLYTHFFVLGFNELGDVLWSNSAPLDIDEKPFYIKKYLAVNTQNPNLQILYSTWDKIYLHNYNNGELLSLEEIPFTNDEEKLLDSTSKSRYWYGNKFISFGAQKIKNKDDKAKREIFFIEQIEIPTNNGTH